MAVFVFTARLNRKKLALTLLGALAVCGVLLSALALSTRGEAVSVEISPKGIKTAEDRADYLAQWGWLTPAEESAVEELAMPEEFGPEYDKYLALQAQQGFDLTKYAGKRIKRYTYDILNYPGGVQGVQAHLLICKNTVIGGEIFGENLLHTLAMPE